MALIRHESGDRTPDSDSVNWMRCICRGEMFNRSFCPYTSPLVMLGCSSMVSTEITNIALIFSGLNSRALWLILANVPVYQGPWKASRKHHCGAVIPM